MWIEFGFVVGTQTALGTWIVGTEMAGLVLERRIEIGVGIQTTAVETLFEIHFGRVVDKLTAVGEQRSMMSDWRMISYGIMEATWSVYVVR